MKATLLTIIALTYFGVILWAQTLPNNYQAALAMIILLSCYPASILIDYILTHKQQNKN